MVTELHRTPAHPVDPSARAQDRSTRRRWRPTRAGIVNVWRYYDETFDLHEGRLLLRGPNGTGKSKALELLLPYLLDANLRPNRLSTFGGSERSMYWNLMGDGYPHTRRVGYVWLEFCAADGSGDEQWFTCGARLQATKNSRQVQSTYFTTSLRVDIDGGLSLTTPDGRPLAKKDLDEAIGDSGQTFDTAAGYRRTVRHTLFSEFTEEQYEALITALLQLRTPKLSEHLDPDTLSELLTQALPPLDQADVAEIAEGFEKLDRRREDLARLEAEVKAAESLAVRARNYARRVLRSGAAAMISATSAMTAATRKLNEREEEHEQTTRQLGQLETRQAELEEERHQIRQEAEGLEESDSYREGKDLDALRQTAEKAEERARKAHADALARDNDAAGDEESARRLRHTADTAAEHAVRAREEADQAARRAGMAASFGELTAGDTTASRRLLRATTESRQEQIQQVRHVLGKHQSAVAERARAEERLEQRRDEAEQAQQRLEELRQQRDDVVGRLGEEIAEWARGCRDLPLAEHADALIAAVEDEGEVLRLVGAAVTRAGEDIARAETALETERRGLTEERDSLAEELSHLERDTVRPPEAPRTRTLDRAALPGAPLWRLVDWRPDVDEATQAGIEAALEASGVLDAWVLPSGEVHPDGHDTFAAAGVTGFAPGTSLAEVLVAEPQASVPASVVERLLAQVAYGTAASDHPAAVGADGTWRLGVTHGSWAKPTAEHIGATARERARQRRIAELIRQLERLDSDIAGVDERATELAARRQRLSDEQNQRPSHARLHELTSAVASAEVDVAVRRDAEASAETERSRAEQHVGEALRELTLLAGEHELPTTGDGLDTVSRDVRTYHNTADAWLDQTREAHSTAEGANTQETRAQRSRQLAEETQERADKLGQEAADERTKYETVESSIGVEYREILRRLTELRRRDGDIGTELQSLRRQENTLRGQAGQLDSELQHAKDEGRRAGEERDRAAARLRHLTEVGFAADAQLTATLPDMTTTTACLEVARSIADKLASTPCEPRNIKDAENNLSQARYTTQQALAGRADLRLDPEGPDSDVVVLVATVDGASMGAARLHEFLGEELTEARQRLTDDEQQLFDQTLTGDTRRQVATRIRLAEELKDSMNAQLQRVRTVSNLRVKLDWQIAPDLPAGTKEARNLLLRDPASLSEADRQALHDFFRARIEEVRAAEASVGWEQQLLQVLDYRRWHQFVVLMDKGDEGGWVAVTKRRHGALSGGEKAISLHLPLFAAAAAHYRISPAAPRLILLDEVFVGVDDGNRGQLLDLLAAFDLDMVLTSDHEWCTYVELDGIAIHQLVTDETDDAVTTVRFVWDGERLREDEPQPPPVPLDAAPTAPAGPKSYETGRPDE